MTAQGDIIAVKNRLISLDFFAYSQISSIH